MTDISRKRHTTKTENNATKAKTRQYTKYIITSTSSHPTIKTTIIQKPFIPQKMLTYDLFSVPTRYHHNSHAPHRKNLHKKSDNASRHEETNIHDEENPRTWKNVEKITKIMYKTQTRTWRQRQSWKNIMQSYRHPSCYTHIRKSNASVIHIKSIPRYTHLNMYDLTYWFDLQQICILLTFHLKLIFPDLLWLQLQIFFLKKKEI